MQNDSGGRSRLAVRALNLARKLLQLLTLLKIWCHAGAFGAELREPAGWSQWWGSLPVPLRSQQPSQDHLSLPATSLCFTKIQKYALNRGALVTLFLFPAWKRREASYLLSSGFWELPQHFMKCYRSFLPGYCVCFAERDIETAKKCKLFFSQWCKLSVLESIKKPEFVTSFVWPLNHVFPDIERCVWHHLCLSLATGWKSNLIFLGWIIGP